MMKKIFLWIFCILSVTLAFVIILIAIFVFIQIPVDLSGQKSFFEKTASEIMGRKVIIDGKIEVITSLQPSFSINGVHLHNTEGFEEGDFVFIQKAKIQLSIISLLQRKISISELSVQGLKVTLLENDQGNNNWSTSNLEKPASSPPPTEKNRLIDTLGLAEDSLVIDQLNFEDINLSFSRPNKQNPLIVTIQKCIGNVRPDEPSLFVLNGAWQRHPFTSEIKISSLQELLELDRSWMHITTEIAATKFSLEGTINLVTVLDSLDLKVELYGEELDSLKELLGVELPPLKSYKAIANISLQKKLLKLNKLEINVGETMLEGNMIVDARGERPDVKIAMIAPRIQLMDFDFEDKSVVSPNTLSKENDLQQKKSDQTEAVSSGRIATDEGFIKYFTQEAFLKFDATSTFQLNEVLSGNDLVGGGILKANMKKGRFSIDPLQLDLPGGSLFLKMSFLPGQDTSTASLSLKANNYNLGIAARRSNPDTDMGGTLNLDIDLESTGGSLTEILANGNGYIDFSARPENLYSGIMDLWVVNLLAAIVTKSDKGSIINCMIGRWSAKDGVLTPEAFALDTAKMRICGSGKIDMKNETIRLEIAPTPKRKQFFSLATPFSISGKITDINLGVAPGGLVGTSLRFIASPVTTPLSWFLEQQIPIDGSDICNLPIGVANRPEKSLPGCR